MDIPYKVFTTACYPAQYKVGRSIDDSNAVCNYFVSFKQAQEEA